MKKAEDNFLDPQGVVHMHSSITCFSKELVTLLGQANFKYLGCLTDWWDSHDRWVNETISRKQDEIFGMCVNILGATAPEWMSTMLPTEAIGGGFTSRCIFVVESNKAKHVPLPTITKQQKALKEALVHDLKLIALQHGEYSFTSDTAKVYEKWYMAQSKQIDADQYPIQDPNFRSYCERRSTHLRKMCIALQASTNDSRKIVQTNWTTVEAVYDRTKQLQVHLVETNSVDV